MNKKANNNFDASYAEDYRRLLSREYRRLQADANTPQVKREGDELVELLDHCLTLESPLREAAFVEGVMGINHRYGSFRHAA